jgi:hypothetical protein
MNATGHLSPPARYRTLALLLALVALAAAGCARNRMSPGLADFDADWSAAKAASDESIPSASDVGLDAESTQAAGEEAPSREVRTAQARAHDHGHAHDQGHAHVVDAPADGESVDDAEPAGGDEGAP